MTTVARRGKLGYEDVEFGLSTFVRRGPSGALETLNQIRASHVPIRDLPGIFGANDVENALIELATSLQTGMAIPQRTGGFYTAPWEYEYTAACTIEKNVDDDLARMVLLDGTREMTGSLVIATKGPDLSLRETDAADPNDYYQISAGSDDFFIRFRDDSGGAWVNILRFQNTGAIEPTNSLCIKDEDNMASDSMYHLATQQSIKAYADLHILHSLAIAANDFLVASGAGVFVKKTLAETGAILEGDINHDNLVGFAADEHYPAKDEDNMASDSAVHTATQQSIKAYFDNNTTSLQRIHLKKSAAGEGLAIGVGNEIEVIWDALEYKDAAYFTHDVAANEEQITIVNTGVYRITCGITHESDLASGRTVAVNYVKVNGAIIHSTKGWSYSRGADYGKYNDSLIVTTMSLTANDVITIGMYLTDEAVNVTITEAECELIIEALATEAAGNTWRAMHDEDDMASDDPSASASQQSVKAYADLHILHSLAAAVNDFLIASGAGTFVKKTLAETGALLEGDIQHNNLQGVAANEHIDHTVVSVIAGTLLTGGGTIAANRTLNVDEASIDHGSIAGLGDDDHTQYIRHALAAAVNDFLIASGAGVFVKKTLAETGAILEGDISHDNLVGFLADKHIAHSVVSVIAGAGMTGGGAISASRTLNVVGGDGIVANADDIAFDISDANITKDEDDMASDSAVHLATQQSIKKYVDDEVAGGAGGWVYGAQVAAAGTSFVLGSGLPASINTVEILYSSISLNTNNTPGYVQLGDAGGYEVAGYCGHTGVFGGGFVGAAHSTAAFQPLHLSYWDASQYYNGIMRLIRWDISEHLWFMECTIHDATGAYHGVTSGRKTLSGELTQIRMTSLSGAVFDAGEARIRYMVS